jgi:hypothetical protein
MTPGNGSLGLELRTATVGYEKLLFHDKCIICKTK